VKVSLKQKGDTKYCQQNKFLTREAILLIVLDLYNSNNSIFERLQKEKIIDKLLSIKEAETEQITIKYSLGKCSVEEPGTCFLDEEKLELQYTEECEKDDVADCLSNLFYEDENKIMSNLLENCLCGTKEKFEKKLHKKKYLVPDLLQCYLDNDVVCDTQNDQNVLRDCQSKEVGSDKSERSNPNRDINFDKSFNNAFNNIPRNVSNDNDIEIEVDDDSLPNPERRRQKEYEKHLQNINSEPSREERYKKKIVKKIIEGPDLSVRQEFLDWYGGKCQICGKTFNQINNKPFFITHYIISRTIARSAETAGNALCLCADHFAKFVHGEKKAEDIINQIEKLDDEGINEIKMSLCGENISLKFNKKHIIALKEYRKALKDYRKEEYEDEKEIK
ncbi:MAG: hypothetical protein KA886_09110, partial [Candidatus Cloacimonetes bacterium]|nr:hypothetical protein [Candidatus Cloacimonadota bacterium]